MADVRITQNNVKKIKDLSDDAVDRILDTWALMAEAYAKTEITKKKAIDTGNLRNSITARPTVHNGVKATVVGTPVEYGPYVELGTYKMAARPFIRPAVEEHVSDYKEVLMEEMRNG